MHDGIILASRQCHDDATSSSGLLEFGWFRPRLAQATPARAVPGSDHAEVGLVEVRSRGRGRATTSRRGRLRRRTDEPKDAPLVRSGNWKGRPWPAPGTISTSTSGKARDARSATAAGSAMTLSDPSSNKMRVRTFASSSSGSALGVGRCCLNPPNTASTHSISTSVSSTPGLSHALKDRRCSSLRTGHTAMPTPHPMNFTSVRRRIECNAPPGSSRTRLLQTLRRSRLRGMHEREPSSLGEPDEVDRLEAESVEYLVEPCGEVCLVGDRPGLDAAARRADRVDRENLMVLRQRGHDPIPGGRRPGRRMQQHERSFSARPERRACVGPNEVWTSSSSCGTGQVDWTKSS